MKKIKVTKKKIFDSPAVAGILLVAFVLTVVLGLSGAAGNASFSLSPSSGSYNKNTNFTLTIYENSGSEQVNAVDAKLNYDQSKLQFASVSNSGSPFDFCTEKSGGSGSVSIVCAKLGGSVSGQQLVGKVTFKALGGSGNTSVNFAGNSHIVRQSDSEDIWNGNTTGGTYSLKTSSSNGGSGGGSSGGSSSSNSSDGSPGSTQSPGSSAGANNKNSTASDSSEDQDGSSSSATSQKPGSNGSSGGIGSESKAVDATSEEQGISPLLIAVPAAIVGLGATLFAIKLVRTKLSTKSPLSGATAKPSDVHNFHLPNYANTPKPGNVYSPGSGKDSSTQIKPNTT